MKKILKRVIDRVARAFHADLYRWINQVFLGGR